MTLLGFSVASALLASSSAIGGSAEGESGGRAIETRAYELGAGLGIALSA